MGFWLFHSRICKSPRSSRITLTLHVVVKDGKLVAIPVQQLLGLWGFKVLPSWKSSLSISRHQKGAVFYGSRPATLAAPQTG